jgi:hypothetical protein
MYVLPFYQVTLKRQKTNLLSLEKLAICVRYGLAIGAKASG